MAKKTVAVLVVTYNRLAKLVKCLESIFMQTFQDFDVFVIDNASNDGTSDYVRNLHNNRINYINTGQNLGGAGGFSFGLNEIWKQDYTYCLIMDDDTYPKQDSLESMVKKMSILKAGYICSRVNWIDGEACNMNTPSTGKPESLKKVLALDNHLIEIQGCSFVSCLVDLAIVREVGLPIKEFFIYGDDVDFTRRIEKKAKGYLDLDSLVIHDMPSNNANSIAVCEQERIERYFYAIRNAVYIRRKHDHYRFIRLSKYYFRTLFSILKHARNKRFRRITVLNRGFIKGLFFNPKIVFFDQ